MSGWSAFRLRNARFRDQLARGGEREIEFADAALAREQPGVVHALAGERRAPCPPRFVVPGMLMSRLPAAVRVRP